MTRHIAIVTSLVLFASLAGCASAPEGDVEVVTAELDDQYFELVETHDDGTIEVEVYYSAGQGEDVAQGVFAWPEGAPTPAELVDILASVDERVIEHATPIDNGTATLSVNVVWPRLLQEAQLVQQLDLSQTTCDETVALVDCLLAN